MPSLSPQPKLAINATNASIDVRDLVEVRPEPGSPVLSIEYDPSAKCPAWSDFIGHAVGGRSGPMKFVQRAVGYSLTASIRETCAFILAGQGHGKTTLLTTLATLFSEVYAPYSPELLSGPGRDVALSPFEHARLCTGEDFGFRAPEDVDGFKALVGGEMVSARERYQKEARCFPFCAKLWLSLSRPGTKRGRLNRFLQSGVQGSMIQADTDGVDYGWPRRFAVIEFPNSVPQGQRRDDLLGVFKSESAGILNWAIQGAHEWYHHGLGHPNDAVTV